MRRGVTLLELVIVLGIIAVLCFVGVSSFSRLRSNSSLSAARQDILSALSTARNLTLESKNQSVYGVHFASSSVVVFVGSTYSSTASSTNIVYPLGYHVVISKLALGGGSDVVFKRLTGETNASGTVTVQKVSDKTQVSTTTIRSSGIIE